MSRFAFRLPSERGDRVWNRALSIGVTLAVLLHLFVLLWFRAERLLESPFAAAGPDLRDPRAAEGGAGGMEMVRWRVPERPAPVEQAVPVPVEIPEVEITPEPLPEPVSEPAPTVSATLTTPGHGAGSSLGQVAGPGLTDGAGAGAGGADVAGRSALLAPVPRGMILPPANRPRSVRGLEVTVWVFVAESGRVVPDSTRLEPPTPDAGYNRRLRQTAAEWSFEPARRTGRPVASWYSFQTEL